ncbi:MAG: DUF2939 domain-containing protein [Candidatus Binataceae bacterium]
MPRFIVRHFTAILVALIVGWWAIFYLPDSPTWAVLWLRNAVQNRDGEAAVRYIDFQSVIQHAAKEMTANSSDPLGAFVGQAAVQLLSRPMATMAEGIAKQKVDEGDPNLQIPAAGVAGAVLLLHRSGDSAWTKFDDRKGQTWEIHLTREDGRWQITEVKNARQLLEKLEQHEAKQLNIAP